MRRGIFIGSRANHNNSPTVTTVRLSDLPVVFRLVAAGRQREGRAARALAHQKLPTEDVQVVAYHGRPAPPPPPFTRRDFDLLRISNRANLAGNTNAS
jgi:hypothetical protein